jgi:hypothetical protein
MNYAAEMSSGVMIQIPSFIKIGSQEDSEAKRECTLCRIEECCVEATCSSEPSVLLTRDTWPHVPDDGIPRQYKVALCEEANQDTFDETRAHQQTD